MAEAVDKQDAAGNKSPEQTPAQKALCEFVQDRYRYLSQDRLAEDDMWFRSGLFNQDINGLRVIVARRSFGHGRQRGSYVDNAAVGLFLEDNRGQCETLSEPSYRA